MQLKVKEKKIAEITYRRKQGTRKVPPNLLRAFKVRKKVPLMSSRPKHSIKVKSYV